MSELKVKRANFAETQAGSESRPHPANGEHLAIWKLDRALKRAATG
jgi:hypothetical protein